MHKYGGIAEPAGGGRHANTLRPLNPPPAEDSCFEHWTPAFAGVTVLNQRFHNVVYYFLLKKGFVKRGLGFHSCSLMP